MAVTDAAVGTGGNPSGVVAALADDAIPIHVEPAGPGLVAARSLRRVQEEEGETSPECDRDQGDTWG